MTHLERVIAYIDIILPTRGECLGPSILETSKKFNYSGDTWRGCGNGEITRTMREMSMTVILRGESAMRSTKQQEKVWQSLPMHIVHH